MPITLLLTRKQLKSKSVKKMVNRLLAAGAQLTVRQP